MLRISRYVENSLKFLEFLQGVKVDYVVSKSVAFHGRHLFELSF